MNSQDSFSDKKVLLIDIGGTNIRTATAEIGSNEINNASKQNLDCLDSFDQIIQNLLSKDQNIKHIVFSVAGPKLHQSITMTNRNFEINEKTILKKFSLDSCHILNDWESIGHGLSLFDTKAMSFINKCDGFNQTSLVIGPGTGLGAAQVIKDNIVLPTEIGNSFLTLPKLFEDFEPIAIENFNIIESIISGGGLKQIYKILSNEEKSSEEIVSSFSNDEFSQKAINFFLNSFSQILSELALAYMPGNGVFIAGGLMRSMHQFIDNSIFMKNFLMNRKSMHAKILSQMPIAIINQEMTCLHGSLNFINKISEKHK
ncbi:MAG: glucokinase [SAR86 cluster bacterium]|uniref:Glucokinase n=1 Tax=SAR86 cluster bacterium TaxID=2030880 RepID=A0A838Y765_9GAMM|nr:glucokinase [SAR86 cluster bacterium]